MTTFEELLPVIDRVVAPITDRMGRMEAKLDTALLALAQVAVLTEAQTRTNSELSDLSSSIDTLKLENAKAKGTNTVIVWVLGLIGAPTVVALIGLGLAKAFGVHS